MRKFQNKMKKASLVMLLHQRGAFFRRRYAFAGIGANYSVVLVETEHQLS